MTLTLTEYESISIMLAFFGVQLVQSDELAKEVIKSRPDLTEEEAKRLHVKTLQLLYDYIEK